jgi:hypothetical protein
VNKIDLLLCGFLFYCQASLCGFPIALCLAEGTECYALLVVLELDDDICGTFRAMVHLLSCIPVEVSLKPF